MSGNRRIAITTIVNDKSIELEILASDLLIDVLREQLHLTGVKRSCDVQICGTCTVLLDDAAVSACTTLAAEIDGSTVRTVEGLASGEELSDLQQAFVNQSALQCGFCTPGFLMSATAMMQESPTASSESVAHYLSGNICRCGCYKAILAAVQEAQRSRGASDG